MLFCVVLILYFDSITVECCIEWKFVCMELLGLNIAPNAPNLMVFVWFEREELYFARDSKDISIVLIDGKFYVAQCCKRPNRMFDRVSEKIVMLRYF